MKKLLFLFPFFCGIICALSFSAKAQNIQLHYDFGHLNDQLKTRPCLTTTVEHFRPDRWGSTFYFIDMDYNGKGIKSAYWEIGRDLKFWKAPLALHIEYNGGLSNAFSYKDAYLLGATYSYNATDFKYGFSVTPSYKYLAKTEHPHSMQMTATWFWHMADGMFSFTGFADVWGINWGSDKPSVVFLSEPQIWFNFNKLKLMPKDFNLSFGSELELSYNFVGNRLFAIPTLALKWTF